MHDDYALACVFETGNDDVPQSVVQSIEYLKKSADNGNPIAQHKLSRIYRRGRGTKPDPAEAERYALMAATQNYLPAIGVCYDFGYGVPKNQDLSHELYAAAHAAGDPIGTLYLMLSYRCGSPNRPPDIRKSFELAEYGASCNISDCVLELANNYHNGYGVAVDKSRAFDLYHTAAKLGNVDAYKRLGDMYDDDDDNDSDSDDDDKTYQTDKIAAFHWYYRAARQDHACAMYLVAYAYLHAEADPAGITDVEQAIRWYRRSAAFGDTASQLAIARFFEFGPLDVGTNNRLANPDFVVETDLRKAVESYRSAADQLTDNPDDLFALEAADSLRRLADGFTE